MNLFCIIEVSRHVTNIECEGLSPILLLTGRIPDVVREGGASNSVHKPLDGRVKAYQPSPKKAFDQCPAINRYKEPPGTFCMYTS